MLLRIVLGIAIGGSIGGLLGYFGKCSSGACPLTANPWRGGLIGAIMGLMLVWSMGGSVASNPEHEKNANEGGLYITSESDFDRLVMQSSTPVMVDFYTPSCGACRTLSPTVSLLKDRYAGKAAIYKVDVSKLPELGSRFEVRVVPTVSFFAGGEHLRRLIGARGADVYAEVLDGMIDGTIAPREHEAAQSGPSES